MVKRSGNNGRLKAFRPFIKGVIAGLVTLILFTLLFSVAFMVLDAPDGADTVLAFIALAFACTVCGFFVGGCKGKDGFFWGAVGGFVMFVLCVVGALITGNADGTAVLSKLICCVLCGTFGGILGVNLIKK